MPSTDPPEHQRKRSPTLSMVRHDNLRSYDPTIRTIAGELIDRFADREEVDFYAEFAEILPLRVIMAIMALPAGDYEFCKRISNIIGVSQVFAAEAQVADAQATEREAARYMEELVLERHRSPGDDFVSEMIAAQVARDGTLALGYLAAQAHNMLFAGNITTTHMLGSAMLLLLEHPDEMLRVRANRTLLRPMLEEVLRLECPVQFIWRQAIAEAEIGGVPIPVGARLALFLGGANRDERKFEDPDRFWVGRPQVVREQLAFGRGIHRCLGRPLARLEGEVAFDVLFERLASIRLATDRERIRHITNPSFRAPAQLPLRVEPARREALGSAT
jgi:cytochrome P450